MQAEPLHSSPVPTNHKCVQDGAQMVYPIGIPIASVMSSEGHALSNHPGLQTMDVFSNMQTIQGSAHCIFIVPKRVRLSCTSIQRKACTSNVNEEYRQKHYTRSLPVLLLVKLKCRLVASRWLPALLPKCDSHNRWLACMQYSARSNLSHTKESKYYGHRLDCANCDCS